MVKCSIARSICALAAACFAGCARVAAPVAVPMQVSVPIPEPVYCAAPLPSRPALAVAELNAGSTPADTIRAYAETVAILKAAVVERDQLLAACESPAPAPASGSSDETAQ